MNITTNHPKACKYLSRQTKDGAAAINTSFSSSVPNKFRLSDWLINTAGSFSPVRRPRVIFPSLVMKWHIPECFGCRLIKHWHLCYSDRRRTNYLLFHILLRHQMLKLTLRVSFWAFADLGECKLWKSFPPFCFLTTTSLNDFIWVLCEQSLERLWREKEKLKSF